MFQCLPFASEERQIQCPCEDNRRSKCKYYRVLTISCSRKVTSVLKINGSTLYILRNVMLFKNSFGVVQLQAKLLNTFNSSSVLPFRKYCFFMAKIMHSNSKTMKDSSKKKLYLSQTEQSNFFFVFHIYLFIYRYKTGSYQKLANMEVLDKTKKIYNKLDFISCELRAFFFVPWANRSLSTTWLLALECFTSESKSPIFFNQYYRLDIQSRENNDCQIGCKGVTSVETDLFLIISNIRHT